MNQRSFVAADFRSSATAGSGSLELDGDAHDGRYANDQRRDLVWAPHGIKGSAQFTNADGGRWGPRASSTGSSS